jgi:hypothetical protein
MNLKEHDGRCMTVSEARPREQRPGGGRGGTGGRGRRSGACGTRGPRARRDARPGPRGRRGGARTSAPDDAGSGARTAGQVEASVRRLPGRFGITERPGARVDAG